MFGQISPLHTSHTYNQRQEKERKTEDMSMGELEKREEEEVLLLDHLEREEEEEEVPHPGFRFHPTDEELVGFYLRRKVEKKKLSIDIIKQVDIYKFDPWNLAIGAGENESYFFCLRGMKYRNSVRPNRVTGSGYWKATGIDKKIVFPHGTNNCIGLKKSLVYYCGKGGKGTKTYWMMHEFRLPRKEDESSKDTKSNDAHKAENWTICRIFKRNASPTKESASHSKTPMDHTIPNSSLVDPEGIEGDIYRQNFQPSVGQPHEESQVMRIDWQGDLVANEYNGEHWNDEWFAENPDFNFDGMNWDELGRMFEVNPTAVHL